LDLPDPARGVLGRAALHRAAAQPRDRAQHPLQPAADARRRGDPRAPPLPGGSRALRLPAHGDGPRPLSRLRRDHAVGRQAPRRRGAHAARPAPLLRPRRPAADDVLALRRHDRPARRDAGAPVRHPARARHRL
ncbi:MAG: Transcriptional regulator, HxlR family, partial [uncultured Gemmatimonadaceae bacterium]